MNNSKQSLQTFLAQFTENDWLAAVDGLLPCVHEVDAVALQIWFRFYPLSLYRYLNEAEDRDEAARGLVLQGEFDLSREIDTSHHFLYGHRYWAKVKRAILKEAEEFTGEPAELLDVIKEVGIRAGKKLNVERSLVNAMAAIGLMTFNQVGMEAFAATPGETEPKGIMKKSPDAIVAERAKDDSQGLLGFLKTVDKRFSVAFAGVDFAGKFPVMNDQQLTHAASQDRSQNWQVMDNRCWEGPIPVECTAASCGTCWIGVLGGAEKLSAVSRREQRAMKVFGYNQPEGEKPFLRLACQTKAYGNATIVIPPWNAVFGKKVRGNVEEIELEPVTTSAQKLRELTASVLSGE